MLVKRRSRITPASSPHALSEDYAIGNTVLRSLCALHHFSKLQERPAVEGDDSLACALLFA